MIIQSPTPKLEESLNFYKKLNFSEVDLNDEKYVTDGKALIKINTSRYARPGVLLYRQDWSEVVEKAKSLVPVYEKNGESILADSTGSWIYLLSGDGPTFKPQENCYSTLGNFAGMSLETISMSQSQKLWELFGFKVGMGGPDQGWMTMNDENNNSISFMHPNACPHLFYNPSLTYFNGANNPKVIQEIRDADIPITEEITFFNKNNEVDNVIIKDPGGLGFFIFNDG